MKGLMKPIQEWKGNERLGVMFGKELSSFRVGNITEADREINALRLNLSPESLAPG